MRSGVLPALAQQIGLDTLEQLVIVMGGLDPGLELGPEVLHGTAKGLDGARGMGAEGLARP